MASEEKKKKVSSKDIEWAVLPDLPLYGVSIIGRRAGIEAIVPAYSREEAMAKTEAMVATLVDIEVHPDGSIKAEYEITVTPMDEEETDHDED